MPIQHIGTYNSIAPTHQILNSVTASKGDNPLKEENPHPCTDLRKKLIPEKNLIPEKELELIVCTLNMQ